MFARLLLAAGAALAAAPALAGSLDAPASGPAPVLAPARPGPTPFADWSGFYAGVQLGWGRLTIIDFDDDHDGALRGLHSGYQHDFGRLVLGGELDWDSSDIALTLVEVDSILRAKLRLGYDAGRVLPYLAAGWAKTVMSSKRGDVDAAVDGDDEGTFWGAGLAYALVDRFVLSAEVLRHRFDDSLIGQYGEPPYEDNNLDVRTITQRASMRF